MMSLVSCQSTSHLTQVQCELADTCRKGLDCHDTSPESEVNAQRALVTSMYEANPQSCVICRLFS